jgi:Transmembrane amino acid transporter protein
MAKADGIVQPLQNITIITDSPTSDFKAMATDNATADMTSCGDMSDDYIDGIMGTTDNPDASGLSIASSNSHLPLKKTGIFGTSSNLVNSIVGAGIIGIPYAFRQSGLIVGMLLLLLVACLTGKALVMRTISCTTNLTNSPSLPRRYRQISPHDCRARFLPPPFKIPTSTFL